MAADDAFYYLYFMQLINYRKVLSDRDATLIAVLGVCATFN